MAPFELTQPRLKLISAVSSNFVTAAIAAAVTVGNSPIYLMVYLFAATFFTVLALNSERLLMQFP